MHLWEDNYLLEIVDPQTGEPLPEGQTGELVLTTLRREAMPLLRYRSRDITSIIPGPCPCGRTHRRLHRITGRADDMLVVRGVNIYPQQIEQVLMTLPSVGRNYQIVLEGLQSEIADRLRAEILTKPKVHLVPPGTLPVSEGKAKRVIDTRSL
jgi:phenylacetate-CoA ligase